MHSTHQPPIVGVTELRLVMSSSTISAEAILGGVATMKAFVALFPPGLVLTLWVIFRLVGMQAPWQVLLAGAPWIVLAPLISSMMERRTTRAVEVLVRGMAQAAERAR